MRFAQQLAMHVASLEKKLSPAAASAARVDAAEEEAAPPTGVHSYTFSHRSHRTDGTYGSVPHTGGYSDVPMPQGAPATAITAILERLAALDAATRPKSAPVRYNSFGDGDSVISWSADACAAQRRISRRRARMRVCARLPSHRPTDLRF